MDIGAWLRALGLGQYETTFRESEIDAEVLPDLTEGDLNQLGVPLGHRKRLLKAIAALGTEETAAKPPSPAPASSPATAAERRPITVMFCDLVGSTSMAAKLDAEDWRNLVNAYLDEASAAVTGLGGHVLKKLGDGLMALFGYPHAQENDAERAVRAALAIQRALVEINARNASKGAPELSARIGLDSGQVVVDATGEVFGEAPNIAARVQGAAEPGSILITAAVQRQTAGLFVAEERGQHELKGVSAPMTLYRVVRASGGGRRGGARALTPLVGREEELDLLTRRWQRARNGEGQLALIVGEPGLGKSRLMEEFHGRLGETPHTWVEWSSSQLLQNTPLHPIAEWGRQRFGADLPAEQRLADLENTLELVGLDPTEYAPLLAPLVDVLLPDGRVAKLAPEELRRRQLAAMTAWVLASARTQPAVVAFEDLHWADPTSLDLMRGLAERGAQAPLLIIATARPEFRPPWSVRSHHSAISLSPLDSAQIAKMVRELSSRHALPKDIVEGVSERTGGVPLFIEEVTRLLLERGEHGGAQAIPPTLQQSLAARLDRLGSARETAQIGAVLGRGFSYALLAAVAPVHSPSIDGRPSGRPLDRGQTALSERGYSDPAVQSALDRLAEADILFVEGDGAQATYRFKHALIQDAAYDSLLKSRRQALHRRAAEILCESASPEPEAIAHHFTQAGLDDQAIEWWGKAGDQALRRSAFQEAIAHLGKAIAMADKGAGAASLPDAGDATASRQRVKLQADYSEAVMYYKGFSAEETKAAWARAAELGANRDDFSERSTVRHGQWTLAIVRGELHAAQELASTFLREAEDAGRPVEAGVARRSLGIICYYSGDFLNARIHCERALDECRQERDLEARERFSDDTSAVAMSILAITSWQLGEVERANELINVANHRAAELGHAPSRVHPLYWKSILEILRGDAAAALITAKALEDLCKEHGMGEWGAVAEMVVGWAHGRLGNPTAGAAEMRQALAVLINKGGRLLVAFFQGLLADLELETSGADSAVARIDQALASADQATNFASLPFLHRLRGDILLKRNPPNIAPAEDAYQTAIAVAKQQGARSYELLASLSLAKLCQSTGRPVDAYAVLAPALEGFSPTPEMPEIAEARALLTALAESEEVKSATSTRQQHARLQVSLANALMQGRGFAVPETMAAFARARELSAEIGVSSERHSATYGVWLGAYMRGELAPMREQAQKFLAEIAARPEAPEAGVAQRISGLTHWFAGEFVEARARFQQALAIFDPDRDGDLVFRFGQDPGLAAQVCLALTLWPMGEFDRARACVAEMAGRLPAVSHPPSLAYAHSHAAMFEIMRGDVARAMPHARATAAVAREHDLVGWRHVGAFFEGWAEVHDGDRSLGLKLMKQAVLQSPPRQRGFLSLFFETKIAEADADGGSFASALEWIDDTIAENQKLGRGNFRAESYRARGEILLKQSPSNSASAEEALLDAIAIAQHQKARAFELRAALSLAKRYHATGRDAAARAALGPALGGFSPTPEMPEIAEAQALLTALAATPEVKAQAAHRQRLTQLHVSYGNALIAARGYGAPETTEAFAKAREAASGDKDAPGRLSADYGLWVGSLTRGDLPSMRAHSADFLNDVGGRPDSPEAGVAYRAAGTTCWFAGEYREARDHFERALALFEPGRDDDMAFRFGQDPGVSAMAFFALALWPAGETDRAASLMSRMLARIASLTHGNTIALGHMLAAQFALMLGGAMRGEANFFELARIAGAHDLAQFRAFGRFFDGWARVKSDLLGGLDGMRRGVDSLRAQNILIFDSLSKIALAKTEAEAGDPGRAAAILDDALATADRVGHRAFEAELHRARGELLLKRDPANPAPAEEAFLTAIAVANQQGARSFELRAALSLAKLYQSTGRPVEAHAVLAPALEGFAPTPEMPEIAEAQALLTALVATDEVKLEAAHRHRLTQLHVSYGNALIAARGYGAPETTKAFARARESAAGDKEVLDRLAAEYGLWAASFVRGELAAMRARAAAFLSDVEARPDSPEAGIAHRLLGVTHWFAGEFAEAHGHLERALALFEPGRDDDLAYRFGQDPGVVAMLYFANTLWVLGDVEGAAPLIGGAEARIAALTHVGSRAYGKMLAAQLAFERGEVAQTASSASELVRLARDHDLNFWHPYGLILEGWTKTESGAPGGLEDMRRGTQLLQEQSVLAFDGTLGLALSQAEARAGDQQRALAVLDEALASSNRTGGRGFDAELHRARGESLLKQSPANPAPAEEAFLTAISVAKQQGARSFELRAAMALAELYQSTARPADAHAVLAPALDGFAPTPEMPEVAEAQALLAALGETDEVKLEAAHRQRLTQLHVSYGNALIAARGYGAPETTEAFAKARVSTAGDRDAPGRLSADYGLWVGSFVRGDLPSMRAHAAAFLSDIEASPDSPEAGVAYRAAGMNCWHAGEYAQARDPLERALALFQPGRDDDLAYRFGVDPGVGAMAYLAVALWPLGEVDRAASVIDRMQTRIADLTHVGTLAFGRMHAALFELTRGDPTRAAPNAFELARLAREQELTMFRAFGVFLQGWATGGTGEVEHGLSDMRRGVELLREQNVLYFDGQLKIALAEAEARAGDPGRGVVILDEALATGDRTGYRAFEAELHRARGELLWKRDRANSAPAEEAFLTAIAVAKQQGPRSFELRAALSLAKLHQSTGRPAEAHAVLAPALEGFLPTPEMPEIAEAVSFMAAAEGRPK